MKVSGFGTGENILDRSGCLKPVMGFGQVKTFWTGKQVETFRTGKDLFWAGKWI